MALLAVLLAALPLAAHPAQEPVSGVTHLRLEGPLDIGHQALLVRSIAEARQRDDRLVIELDTPGGEVQLAWRMAWILDEASVEGVRTVAWVNDRALSAGALLTLACDEVFMRGTATFGGAQTISVGLDGQVVGVSADEVVEEKQASTWRSAFRSFAQARGRSADLAEAMVDPGVRVRRVRVDLGEERIVGDKAYQDLLEQGVQVKLLDTLSNSSELLTLTAEEAVRYGMANARADTLQAVLSGIGLPAAAPRTLTRSRSEDVAALLHSISPLLLILGLVLAFVELKAPGFGVPGILSAACFGALLFGRYLVGLAEIGHILLIAAGLILFAVELFLLPGTIWVGLLGAVAIVIGLVASTLSSGGGFEHEFARQLALDGAVRVALSGFVAALCMYGLSRVLPHTPLYARLAVSPADVREPSASALPEAEGAHARAARPGAVGVALTSLRPVGKVVLNDDPALEYEARSSGPELERGASVVVVEARGGRLVVEAAGGEVKA